MDEVADEIDLRLQAACVPGSSNCVTASEIREWTVEYLREYDGELAKFPRLVGKPHWNLWMIDGESENALFAVLAFHPDRVEFHCGIGNSYAVQDLSTNTVSKQDEVIREMRLLFRVEQDVLVVTRGAAESWLGRSW